MKNAIPFLISILSCVGLFACNSEQVCQKHYDTPERQMACVVGSDRVGRVLAERSPRVLQDFAFARNQCETRCDQIYSSRGGISTDDPLAFGESLSEAQNLIEICISSCRLRIEYESQH